MKKLINNLKGKKVLSFVLAAIMLVTTFSVAVPMLKLDTNAAGPIGGITQERVVGTDGTYASIYDTYASNFLNGAGKATNIVIPGLNVANDSTATEYQENDFVVQGLSYYPKQDWMMVTVYHNDGALPSMIFALDAKSGEFKHAFEVVNSDGTPNMEHGGGLAFSEYNFYYSGDDSDLDDGDGNGNADQIAYAPLSYFDNPIDSDNDGYCEVKLAGAVDLPELNGAATAYVCYDEGVLWAGNFYEDGAGAGNYKVPAMPEDSTNGIALHNSMIYGYKLQGGSSEEEWQYLTGAKGNTSDRAGAPSHCIAVSTDYEDIQYAVVDNGKVYISRSWGTGENDDWVGATVIGSIAALDEYSTLTVGDIDLSVEGTEPIKYTTTDGTVVKTKAHKLDATNVTHFDMMPMSEGLCFVEDNLYISFEGASNKYKNEYAWSLSNITNTGNCAYPIDVVWKVDPYVLMEEERKETKEAVYFEKVTRLEDLRDDEEYIILYESKEKDPVTQKNILYAFDAHGNFKDYKLSKSTDTKFVGYEGMIGHAISEYSIENGELYLTNPEKDDLPSLRWNIIDADEDGKLRIQSPLTYFSGNRNFHFKDNKISMINDTGIANDPLTLEVAGDTGNFYLKNDDDYLWCNDFSVSGYEASANNWYSTNNGTKMYQGINEEKGTFHTDALNLYDNILGKAIDDYRFRQFSIYKSVEDHYSSTAQNRVYTDMSAKLQSNGTYTVALDTYATSALHYKSSEVEKPTDFIFVLDTSTSMATGDATGMIEYLNGDLSAYSIAGDNDRVGDTNAAVGHGEIYLNINGEFVNVSVEASERMGSYRNYYKYFWIYGTYQGKRWYWWPDDVNTATLNGGHWDTTKPTEAQTMKRYGNSDADRADAIIYVGTHYRYTTNDYYNPSNQGGRYITMRETACNIIDEVAADASLTGLDHRFAVTCYGNNNGFYDSSTNTLTTGNYTNAFWTTSRANDLKNTINSITVSAPSLGKTLTSTDGVAFEHANGIIAANNGLYKSVSDGGRNVAVIFISDGFPGDDSLQYKNNFIVADEFILEQKGTATDANNVIAQAKTAKENGAFIYTILIGQTSPAQDLYKKDVYMQAVSSQYPEAESLSVLGGECTELTAYNIDLSTSSSKNYITYVDKLVKNVKTNDRVAVEKLEGDTIIYEQLSDAFIIPKDGNDYNYDYDVELYRGYYDCLGRFQFETTVNTNPGVTVTPQIVTLDNDRPAIKIVGFNYSDQYIANGHDGNILRVTINGLEANHKADITNTSINDTATTAIYQSSNMAEPFKYFPTEYFTIPEYTYVLDYDLPMLDTDINGTLLSVDGTPTRQTTTKVSRQNSNIALNFVDSNLNMTYELKSGAYNEDDNASYCLIDREDGTYDWFKINIVPASNVLLEEKRFTPVSTTSVADDWSLAGTALGNTYQSLSGKNDLYGYDDVYADNGAGYSNGTAYKSTVDSDQKRSETMKFSYTGTGFDLMAACGASTGIEIIKVMKVDGETKTPVKAMIVDTYYNGDYIDANYGTLNQVPIARYEGEYGTYEVEVTAAYLSSAQGVTGPRSVSANPLLGGVLNAFSTKAEGYSIDSILDELDIDIPADEVELVWFDDNSVLNGGTGPASAGSKARSTSTAATNVELACYIDSVRVYNPLGDDTTNYIASEKGAQYYNIIDELADTENGALTSTDSLFAYVTGALDPNKNGTILSFENYQTVGPQHEVYLEKATGATDSHAVSFKVTVPTADSRVMISLRAVNGATTAKIASGKSYQFDINTATEQYFDITPYLDTNDDGVATVTVTNVGDGLLSVNNLKVVGGGIMPLSDEDLPVMAMALATEPITIVPNAYDYDAPVVNEDVQEPETDAPAEDDTPEADEPVADVPMDLTSIIKMLLKFIETIILKFF